MTYDERKRELFNQGWSIARRTWEHDFLNPESGFKESIEDGMIKLVDNPHGDSYCRCDVIYFTRKEI